MYDLLDGIVLEIANRVKIEPREGDYFEGGIRYCGKCKKPREFNIPLLNGATKKVPCSCDCDVAEDKREDERIEKMGLNAKLRAIRSVSMMDSIYADMTFDKLVVTEENRRNLALCKRYVSAFDEMIAKHQGMLFYGGVGTGKSCMAACVANELIAKGIPVIMTSFVKILAEASVNGLSDAMIASRLNNAKLVIFDDLGAERYTDYALEKVYNLIDSRVASGLPMIITTNLTLNEMKNERGTRLERIYDRIIGTCYPMKFTGISFRKKSAFERYGAFKDVE